jgi:hypothetical protein
VAYAPLPPALVERRDDERAVFLLVNALRRRLVDLTNPSGGSAAAILSMRIGRGDSFQSSTGAELIIDEFELPVAVAAFSVTLAGRASSASGTATFRVRLGGTDGVATDGTVIATALAAATSIQRIASAPTVVSNGALTTLVKITGQSAAGHLAVFRAGTLALN